jgi:DUF177 domain-containing protein
MAEKTTPVQHDTVIHVAQFLKEGVGATRQSRIALDQLPLDGDLLARQVEAEVKLTRIPSGILAGRQVQALVTLECIRCLEEFDQSVQAEFADEYRPTIDILTGTAVRDDPDPEDEAEYFTINDLHLLDVRESLRQALVLGLPMAPVCREDCPGLPEAAELLNEGDARLAVLARLLGDDDAATEADEQTTAQANGARRRAKR